MPNFVQDMLQITKKTDYGLTLLINLAKQNSNKPTTLAKIAAQNSLPKSFLAKLASLLVKAEIIKSREGARGGYFLSREPEKISLNEILVVLEKKKTKVKNCESCDCGFCTTRDVAQPLEEEIIKTLSKKTLADFMRKDLRPMRASGPVGGEVDA